MVRDRTGDPVVIENAPLLDDGTPMPTGHWLVGHRAVLAVSRLEADGGVDEAEASVDAAALAATHAEYSRRRDALIPSGANGPLPIGREWRAPAPGSSASMRTTRGTSPEATTRSAAGCTIG